MEERCSVVWWFCFGTFRKLQLDSSQNWLWWPSRIQTGVAQSFYVRFQQIIHHFEGHFWKFAHCDSFCQHRSQMIDSREATANCQDTLKSHKTTFTACISWWNWQNLKAETLFHIKSTKYRTHCDYWRAGVTHIMYCLCSLIN